MKSILIIGAGRHGRVVAEIAEACGFHCAFLDDRQDEGVIGSLDDIERYAAQYDGVIVSIGNNEIRKKISDNIHNIFTLIHPRAYVSPSASIGAGSIILPGTTINTNVTIGKGCIISIGALIDHDVVIGDYCHINTGAIIEAGCIVPSGMKVNAGATVKKKNS